MPFKPITDAGLKFVADICNSGTPGDKLRGISIAGGMPITLAKSNIVPGTIVDSTIAYNGGTPAQINGLPITSNTQLPGALAYWYTKYCKEDQYDLNANILIAQPYMESGYKLWIYNAYSDMGLAQMKIITAWDIMLTNNYSNITPLFTQDEINTLSLGFTHPVSYYTNLSHNNGYNFNVFHNDPNNVTALYYNMINNPELCVKGQCRLMKYNAIPCNHIASSTIACYAKGNAYNSTTYVGVLNNILNGVGKITGSQDIYNLAKSYVNKIFQILRDEFELIELQNTFADAFYVNTLNSNSG